MYSQWGAGISMSRFEEDCRIALIENGMGFHKTNWYITSVGMVLIFEIYSANKGLVKKMQDECFFKPRG
jgi:hypothetical protein